MWSNIWAGQIYHHVCSTEETLIENVLKVYRKCIFSAYFVTKLWIFNNKKVTYSLWILEEICSLLLIAVICTVTTISSLQRVKLTLIYNRRAIFLAKFVLKKHDTCFRVKWSNNREKWLLHKLKLSNFNMEKRLFILRKDAFLDVNIIVLYVIIDQLLERYLTQDLVSCWNNLILNISEICI